MIDTTIKYLIFGAALLALPAASAAQTGAQDKDVEDRVADDVTKPVKKAKIPEKLKQIQKKPYSLKGLGSCDALQREIRELNEVLGPDVNEKVNKSRAKKREQTAGRVAGSAAGSLIPFGGLIGEISGANKSRRKLNRAIYSGTVRRGFLKGVGLERGCAKPARP